jgi:hypothetical protein
MPASSRVIRPASALCALRAAVRLGLAALALSACFDCAGGPSASRCEGRALLRGAKSGPQGVLDVREANGGIHIRGRLMGLSPGSYALYVDNSGSCRLAPGKQGLRGPLLLFRTDASGSARIDMVTSELRADGGGTAVLGKSLVVEKAFPGETPLAMAACGAVN